MNILNEITELNAEIEYLNSQAESIIKSVDEIVKANEELVKERNNAYYPGEIENPFPNKFAILKYASDIKSEIQSLKKVRDAKLDLLMSASYFSVAELEWILEQFGIYYRTESIGRKTILAPQEFVLLRNKVWDVEDLRSAASLKLTPDSISETGGSYTFEGTYILPEYQRETLYNLYKKVTTTVEIKKETEEPSRLAKLKSKLLTLKNRLLGNSLPLEKAEAENPLTKEVVSYIPLTSTPLSQKELIAFGANYQGEELIYEKAKTVIKPNEYIETLSPSVVVTGNEKVPFYELSGNYVKPTRKILNILPNEVFAFLEAYIIAKASNNSLSLKEYYKANNVSRTLK